MAIKGKKKTQQRGSQARRRPTPAPRPEPRAPRIPWYRKPVIVTPLIVALVIVIGAGAAVIANNRSESKEKEQRQEALQAFTGRVRAMLQRVDPIVGAMVAAGGSQEAPETLAEDTESWATALEGAVVEVSQIVPPPGTESASQLLGQAVGLYQGAVRTFAVATELDGKDQGKVLERAAEQVGQASSIWQIGVTLIDTELADAGLGASQISVPGTTPPPLPSPAPSPSPEDQDTENVETGGGKKGGDNKKDED